MRFIAAVVVMAACRSPQAVVTTATALSIAGAVDCEVPDARPDDGQDDRAALQAGLTRGCAHLTCGTYDVDTPPPPPTGRRPYDVLTMLGSSLYGDGPCTVLRFRGDAAGADWHGVGMHGTGSSVRDMAIDTALLTGTSEQTHAIQMLGPAVRPSVVAVRFNHPARGMPGGDCIQIVGYDPDKLVTDAIVSGVDFAVCDRSGIAVHSGAVGLQALDSVFSDTGDQDIDGEGTGGNRNWTIARNTFLMGPHAQSNLAIQLERVSGASLVDNVVDGRGVNLYAVDHVTLDRMTINRTMVQGAEATVSLTNASTDVVISHSKLYRAAGVTSGAVIQASPHSGGTPARLTVSDSELHQGTLNNAVIGVGVVGLSLDRNLIDTTAAGYSALLANGSTTIRTTDLEVSGNTLTGPFLYAVRVSGSYSGCGSLSTSGNTAPVGLRCENTNSGAKILGPITSVNNTWPAGNCPITNP